jgi:hypothetical protein
MAGKFSVSARLALLATAVVLMLMLATSTQAYRICTFKGSVVENGWRTMTVKSGRQCATVNVGWRTKYIPNRRPCIGERVAVDFILEDGYMKATKVVSLTPPPQPVTCYPPPPPSSAVCRTVAERAEEVCEPARPICSRRPPPHVAEPSWAPAKKRVIRHKRAAKKRVAKRKKVAKAPPTQEVAPATREEKPAAAPIEEKRFKTLTGEVVASSPKSLSVRVTPEGEAAEVINVRVGLKTKFIPFRRPAVGEKVKVDYREENGEKFGYTVQVTQ